MYPNLEAYIRKKEKERDREAERGRERGRGGIQLYVFLCKTQSSGRQFHCHSHCHSIILQPKLVIIYLPNIPSFNKTEAYITFLIEARLTIHVTRFDPKRKVMLMRNIKAKLLHLSGVTAKLYGPCDPYHVAARYNTERSTARLEWLSG